METALYFPYIRVPETSWFTQVLLYWDSAASIVPRRNEDQVGPYMNELIQTHLVQPVRPDRIRNSPEFDDDFLALLDFHDLPTLPHDLPTLIESDHWTRLHHEKVGYRIFRELESRGLARRLDDDYGYSDWYAVEDRTAELFMAYLVGSACRNDKHLFPVTDAISDLHRLGQPVVPPVSRLAAMRYAAITQALPVPSRPVSPTELAEFKDRHYDQLRRLRCYMNGHLADLAEIDDDDVRDAKLESLLQEIHDDVEVLRERMSRRHWPRIVLVGVAGLVASAATIGATIATGGAALALGLGITGGIASVGPAGYQAADLMRSRAFDERSPLAYAALAQAL